jgi:hypothetical protein
MACASPKNLSFTAARFAVPFAPDSFPLLRNSRPELLALIERLAESEDHFTMRVSFVMVISTAGEIKASVSNDRIKMKVF